MNSSLYRWLKTLKRKFYLGRAYGYVKSIGQYSMKILSSLLSIACDKIQKFLRNPLRALGGLVKLILFVLSVIIFAYILLTNDIFIEGTEIQGAAKDHGFTGEMLTERAIAMMSVVARQRLNMLPNWNGRFLQIYEQSFDEYETEKVCNTTLPLAESDFGLILAELPRTAMSSKTPDQVLSSQSVSIKKLAFWIREKIGLGLARQLKPVLYSQGDQFFMKVYPTPSETSERILSFEKMDDAPRILASLLLDFLSPELLATELAGNGMAPDNSSFPHRAANLFLSDKQKELFVLNMFIATQLEFSKSHADRNSKYIEFESNNQMLLEEIDFRRYGDLAVLLQTFLAERIVIAECYKAGKSCNYFDLHEKYIGKYRKDLERTTPGQMLLTFLDIRRGDMSSYRQQLNNLLDQETHLATGDNSVSTLDFVSFVLALLLEVKQFDEANKLLSTPRISRLDPNKAAEKTAIVFRSVLAILKVQQGDPSEYQQLIAEHFRGMPCAEWMTTSKIYYMWKSGALDRSTMPTLSNTMSKSFSHIEKDGLRSFDFYNTWGNIESNAGNYMSAYKKFEHALLFEGDHGWALLNWGWAALKTHGELALARRKFLESLEIGTIPSAVHGLLITLWQQEDGKAFLDIFEKYSETLKDVYEHPVRSNLERGAIYFSCRLRMSRKLSILHRDEGVLFNGVTHRRDQFQKEVCEAQN